MRKASFILFIALLCSQFTISQKTVTLEDIWGGAFRTEGMDVLRSMKNGKQYTVLNYARNPRTSTIDKYNYNTLEKVETVVASSAEIPFFTSYEFSADESKLILATEVEPIFRRSSVL